MEDVARASTMQDSSRVVDANGVAQFEPKNKKEAFRFEAWRKSMQDEYDSLILNGVWVRKMGCQSDRWNIDARLAGMLRMGGSVRG